MSGVRCPGAVNPCCRQWHGLTISFPHTFSSRVFTQVRLAKMNDADALDTYMRTMLGEGGYQISEIQISEIQALVHSCRPAMGRSPSALFAWRQCRTS